MIDSPFTPDAQVSFDSPALAAKMASPSEHFPFSTKGKTSCSRVSTRISPAGGRVGVTVSVGEGVSEGDDTTGTIVDVSVTASSGTEVPAGVPWQALKITP